VLRHDTSSNTEVPLEGNVKRVQACMHLCRTSSDPSIGTDSLALATTSIPLQIRFSGAAHVSAAL
jgi:hypothetical protein